MKVPHPNKLLEKTESMLLFNLLEQASYICNDEVTQALIPSPVGLYVKGHVKPLLNDRDDYYPKSQYGNPSARIIDFKTVMGLQEDIVDNQQNVVLTGYNIINRPHLFTTEPTLPIAAINICSNILVDYLFKYCKYARGFKADHISNYIKPEFHDLMDSEYFEDSLSDALDELHEFTRNHTWNIHLHKLNGTTLIIERLVDWRIYQWTEIMYNKQQVELGEPW